MRTYWIILFLMLSFGRATYAQVSIRGKVKNVEKQSLLEGVVITILKPDSTAIVSYSVSNSKGEFNIEVSYPPDRYLLKASMLGFKTEILRLNNHNFNDISILLVPKVSDLKEVIVRPPKIIQRNDTISYDVASFSNIQDKTIGDVLKKLPGLDIQDDGTVLYNGKAINKFYIEGLDLLNDKYGLAVNNVSPKDVQSVEVLEGHQPIKALKNSMPTDRAALNLKLKKTSKARWLGHLEIAAGVTPALWKMDALGLKFSGKDQILNVLQTNNTGDNIKKQFTTHTLEDYVNGQENQYDQTRFIKVTAENAPLNDERSMLNRTFVFSTNNLHLLRNDYQVKANFNYINDRLSYFKNSVIRYYSPTETEERIVENNAGLSRQNQGNLQVNINKNTNLFYLNNKLSGQMFWDKTDVSTTGSNHNHQQSLVPYHFIDNDFNFIKTYGNKKLAINSFNHIAFQPENLNFTKVTSAEPVNQRADHSDITSHTNMSLTTIMHQWTLEYRAGVKVNVQRLHSLIESNSNSLHIQDSLSNQTYWRSVDYYGSASARFANDVLNFKITLPLNFYDTRLSNAIRQTTQDNNHLYLNPSVILNYKITPQLSMNARAELTTKLLGIEYLSEGYIYQTYRNIILGNNQLNTERRQNYALSLSYRSPVNSLFMAISGSYTPGLRNQISQRSFDNYLMIERLLPLSNERSLWSVSCRISKGVDNINAVASIAITYQNSDAKLLQANQLLKSNNRSLQLTPKYMMNVSKYFHIEYNGSFSSSSLVVSSRPSTGSLSSIYQKLLLGMIISKQLNMKAGIDQVYNQLTQSQDLSVFFVDFNLQYIPAKRIALELSLRNLLNKKTIAYNLIETASSTSSIYTIRPFNALVGMKFTF